MGAEPWSDIWFWEPLATAYFSGFSGMIKLADPEFKVIGRYGLGNLEEGDEVARPAAFLIDQDGVIRWRNLPSTWRDRPGAPDYLKVVSEVLGKEEKGE